MDRLALSNPSASYVDPLDVFVFDASDQGVQGNQDTSDKQGNQSKSERQIVCPANVCEDITITVPVEVHAHADVKNIKLECKGHHIDKCHKTPKNVSKFEVVQEISAQIPIEFVARVEVKDERVDFRLHQQISGT